jgi:hypothetical protein
MPAPRTADFLSDRLPAHETLTPAASRICRIGSFLVGFPPETLANPRIPPPIEQVRISREATCLFTELL